MHAQADKLRQLERAFFPAAREGDFRSAQLFLRIVDKLWRLGKFAREAEMARCREECLWAGLPQAHPTGMNHLSEDTMFANDELKSPLAIEEVP